MRHKSKMLFYLLLMILLSFLPQATQAQSGGGYDLSWSTIDSGGETSTGGNYELQGTIGQSDAGTMQGGNYELNAGYWVPQCQSLGAAFTDTDISVSGGDVVLSWTAVTHADSYTLYDSTTPYQFGIPHASNIHSPYTYTSWNGENRYFRLLASNPCDNLTSQSMGVFSFDIIPGD